jgi:hypothetical protein
MAMGTGPCNPVFDRFLHHTTPSIYLNIFTWISMNWNSHENSRRYQSLECYTYKVMSRISEREKERERERQRELNFMDLVCDYQVRIEGKKFVSSERERERERERAAYKATIEMAFRSQVTKVQLARQGSVPGTHETGTSPFQSLTTSNKKSPAIHMMDIRNPMGTAAITQNQLIPEKKQHSLPEKKFLAENFS